MPYAESVFQSVTGKEATGANFFLLVYIDLMNSGHVLLAKGVLFIGFILHDFWFFFYLAAYSVSKKRRKMKGGATLIRNTV